MSDVKEIERVARENEAKWWSKQVPLVHLNSCSYGATNGPDGDYCDCGLNDRRKACRERLASLAKPGEIDSSLKESG